MKKMNLRSILAVAMALVISLACLAACAPSVPVNGTELASGGVLCLKVNPEIAVTYDADGNVTKVDARNEDARKILETYTGYEGKSCKEVVAELVTAIGEAGYFVEEIEGERRQITIEIEPGSALPNGTFLDDVVAEVRSSVSSHDWTSPVNVQGLTDYGITDYIDTDYGPGNDGVTDYLDTDYGPNNDGVTDYTDYGMVPATTAPAAPAATTPTRGNTDYGVTDYIDTDYGPNNDGITDYYDTDYGPNNDGVTDYNDSPYEGNSGYGSDYGDSRYD